METSNSLLDADIIREQKPVWAFSRKVFCEGIRDGVPIALGYFAVSFSLGIAARKDKVVAVLVAISFALSFACNYLPGISALSDGTRTILLTVLISSAAAVLFPVKDQEAEHDA